MSDTRSSFSEEYVKTSETSAPRSSSKGDSTTAGLRNVGTKSEEIQNPYDDPAKPRRVITRAKIIYEPQS